MLLNVFIYRATQETGREREKKTKISHSDISKVTQVLSAKMGHRPVSGRFTNDKRLGLFKKEPSSQGETLNVFCLGHYI